MSRKWLAGLLCLCGSAIELIAAATDTVPRIVCQAPSFDFGALFSTQTLEHAFVLGNDGTRELIISNVRACCGATAKVNDTRIPPGSTTKLTVRMTLAGREGAMKKSIYIASNDPRQPFYQLNISGVVTNQTRSGRLEIPRPAIEPSDLVVTPPVIQLTTMPEQKEPVTRCVAVRSRQGKCFAINKLTFPDPAATTVISAVGTNGYLIRINNIQPLPELDGTKFILSVVHCETNRLEVPIHVAPSQ